MNIHRGEVCLTNLPPALKQQAWAYIKANRPELMALLKGEDPMCNLPAVAAHFQAAVWVQLSDTGLSPEALATGALSRTAAAPTAMSSTRRAA